MTSLLKRATALLVISLGLTTIAFGAERGIRRRVEPVYPELARRMRLSGAVKLELSISSAGNVKSVNVLGGNPLLVQAATEAVKKWLYEAGPDETRTVTIDFKI